MSKDWTHPQNVSILWHFMDTSCERVHDGDTWPSRTGAQQDATAKLDRAVWANLKDTGYGG